MKTSLTNLYPSANIIVIKLNTIKLIINRLITTNGLKRGVLCLSEETKNYKV